MKLEKTKYKHLKRDIVSGVYYWRQFADGKEFFRSTGESKSEARAYKIGQRMFAEWIGKPEEIKKAAFFFENVARMYLDQKVNRSHKTRQSAELHLRLHLMPFFKGYSIGRCTELWEAYVAHARSLTPGRKLRHDAMHFKGILKLAFERGMIPRFPSIAKPDPKSEVGREYTEEEIQRLLSNAGPDLKLQIKMGYLMGMRRSEILKLEWSRVNLKDGIVSLYAEHVKTRRGREVPMHIEVWAELKLRYRKTQSAFVFPSPHNVNKPVDNNKTAWRRCKADANVSGRFHDLRHTFITRALHVYKLPPGDISAIAGMSLAQMERYRHARGKYLKQTMDLIRGISGSEADTEEKDYDNERLQ